MKKYVILTSVLALAACGGGSGGAGGGYSGGVERPISPNIDPVSKSNAAITGMVSNSEAQVVTYVVNKLGNDAESVGLGNVARTATSRMPVVPTSASGTMDYDTAKELMELAQWLGDETTTHDDITAMFNKSKDDQNKIKSALKLLDDSWCYVGGDADKTADRILERRAAKEFEAPMAELKEKSEIMVLDNVDLYTFPTSSELSLLKFKVNEDTGQIEAIYYPYAKEIMDKHDGAEVTVGYIKRKDENSNVFIDKGIVDEEDNPRYGETIEYPIEYISYGKSLGLKYSDFGVLRTDFVSTGDPDLAVWGVQETPFAGGYKNKNIDNDIMKKLAAGQADGKIVFAGTARGTVTYHDWDAGIGGADVPLKGGLVDKNATLTFNGQDGSQTLAASFKNWYDIEVIKAFDGTNQIKVVGGTGGDDAHYHMDSSPAGLADGQYINRDNDANHTMDNLIFATGYYGADGKDGTPTEAIGLVQYSRQSGEPHWVAGEGEEPERQDIENHLDVTLGFGGTK